MSFSDGAQHIFCRYLHIFEENLSGGGALDTQFVFLFTERDARRFGVENESCELFAVNFGKNDEHICEAGVGNPHFLSVEHVVTSVGAQVGAGFGVQCIGACAGFGKAVSGLDIAGYHAGQKTGLLFVGAEVKNGQHAYACMGCEGHAERAEGTEYFGDDSIGIGIELHATVVGGHVGAEQAQFTHFFEQGRREARLLFFYTVADGVNFIVQEIGSHLPDHELFLVELLRDEYLPVITVFNQKFTTFECVCYLRFHVMTF